MRNFLLLVVAFVGVIFLLNGAEPVLAQKMPDSLLVHIDNIKEGKEGGELTLNVTWLLYKSSFHKKSGKYTSPTEFRDESLTYKVRVYADSTLSQLVKESPETAEMNYMLTGLDFDVDYWIRVEPVNAALPSRSDSAHVRVAKRAIGAAGEKGKKNIFSQFVAFTKMGGPRILIPMYILALFGLLVAIPTTWWRLRLANIFPPNKSSFWYGALPTDREGKTGLGENGNIFMKEVAKYWIAALESMGINVDKFKSTDDFLKASRDEVETIKKKMWLDTGLPNIDKAIAVCKNGVPGMKYPKRVDEYPITRIFIAALENIRNNTNEWWTSQEVDRATENTSVKEIDALKGWSITALWAVGSVEPMLGLFGTVVGIRMSFVQIQEQIERNPDIQTTKIVPQLAKGIQVALITTITGLLIGIPFMLIYYYYRGKIDWIYSCWENILIDITNKA